MKFPNWHWNAYRIDKWIGLFFILFYFNWYVGILYIHIYCTYLRAQFVDINVDRFINMHLWLKRLWHCYHYCVFFFIFIIFFIICDSVHLCVYDDEIILCFLLKIIHPFEIIHIVIAFVVNGFGCIVFVLVSVFHINKR